MKSVLFYDRSLRLWTLLWQDEDGNQIGTAEYFPTKQQANEWIEQQTKE